ncbi:hypothetical protein [Polyangium jinanense]|uniref:Uncharacterized protein n=1 Tax=Polyangium jinanense TaxID=2829994 RepID=A0A9X3X4M9_9BACT|nr:hypothetical protein [Polyangium jinanense]MDC3956319.1 hypothetical protein [Polyangium jinanense]MDC3982455.1 hypothetical protein [Polyangium jinanense]
MRLHAHALRGFLVGRRLGRARWVSGQITTLSWLARGTLGLLALLMILGNQLDQDMRAKGLMPVQIEPLPFVGAHPCISPSDVEEPPPEEEPPCSRKGKRPDAR